MHSCLYTYLCIDDDDDDDGDDGADAGGAYNYDDVMFVYVYVYLYDICLECKWPGPSGLSTYILGCGAGEAGGRVFGAQYLPGRCWSCNC